MHISFQNKFPLNALVLFHSSGALFRRESDGRWHSVNNLSSAFKYTDEQIDNQLRAGNVSRLVKTDQYENEDTVKIITFEDGDILYHSTHSYYCRKEGLWYSFRSATAQRVTYNDAKMAEFVRSGDLVSVTFN